MFLKRDEKLHKNSQVYAHAVCNLLKSQICKATQATVGTPVKLRHLLQFYIFVLAKPVICVRQLQSKKESRLIGNFISRKGCPVSNPPKKSEMKRHKDYITVVRYDYYILNRLTLLCRSELSNQRRNTIFLFFSDSFINGSFFRMRQRTIFCRL